MKLQTRILILHSVFLLTGNALLAQHSASKSDENITSFYIDGIILSNDSTPRTNINVSINTISTKSANCTISVNNREVIVFAGDGHKADLINSNGLTIQKKQISSGKVIFNVNAPGIYFVKVYSRNSNNELLKTMVL
jgi:hypothetical protein